MPPGRTFNNGSFLSCLYHNTGIFCVSEYYQSYFSFFSKCSDIDIRYLNRAAAAA